MNVIPAHRLPSYVAQSTAIPYDKDRAEVRMYAAVVSLAATGALLVTAYYALAMRASLLWQVAAKTGHPGVVGALFLAASALMMPHVFDLLFRPDKLSCTLSRKMACGAMVLTAVLWGVLATEAKPLGFGLVPLTYWASAVGYLLVGGAFGYSLNAQQGRQLSYENSSKTG